MDDKKRKFHYSIKLYDFNSKTIETLFDVELLFENHAIVCFANKSYKHIYICLDEKNYNEKLQAMYSKYVLINKLKIDKNLNIIKVISFIRANICIEKFTYDMKNYTKFLKKLSNFKQKKSLKS